VDKQWHLIEPGVVLTVESGLYIGEAENVPKSFREFCIRIEDELLSADAPKDKGESEALTRG